ncbi:hypothetical protein AB6A40_009587 [Gnathostoma spinigerum]|uniref:Uncharacterized protein n=1 Tax=Gnathostoma spinigerum TaxID=75299 RepID=A0ABD6EST0_9BILA
MFIESSALDGSNIEESLVLLTRQMMASEDVEMNCASIELMDNKFIRSSSLCCGKK